MGNKAPLAQRRQAAEWLNQKTGSSYKVTGPRNKQKESGEVGREAAQYPKDPLVNTTTSTTPRTTPAGPFPGSFGAGNAMIFKTDAGSALQSSESGYGLSDLLDPEETQLQQYQDSFDVPDINEWPPNAVALVQHWELNPHYGSGLYDATRLGSNPVFPTVSQSWFSPGEATGLGQLLTFKIAMMRNLFTDSGQTTSFTIESSISWNLGKTTRYNTYSAWAGVQPARIPI